jgi:sugar lactone lactonase YvrE
MKKNIPIEKKMQLNSITRLIHQGLMNHGKHIFLFIACAILISTFRLFAQFEEFSDQYDIITTLAGKGDIDDKGVNGWMAGFEAGLAIEAELSRPHFAMADSMGNIYIADKDAHAIRIIKGERIYTAAGTGIAGFDGDGTATDRQLNSPNGLWVHGDGTFYILDCGNSKIRKVSKDGNMTTLIDDPDGISLGRGLWVSNDEKEIFYSSGNKIKKWSQSGGLTSFASGFSQLGNIIIDPNGFLVATDRGANMVYRVFEDGNKTIIAGNGSNSGGGSGFKATETGLDGVRGIWFLTDSSYLLATHEGSQIWYVDSLGVINLFLDGKQGDNNHSGDGEHFQSEGYKISEARSVSVDYEGNILITENDRGFIRKISRKTNTGVRRLKYANTKGIPAFPNPFYSDVMIKYSIEQENNIRIEIYDMLGHKVKSLINEIQTAGIYEIQWDATRDDGSSVNPGMYFYTIHAGAIRNSGKILFSK